MTGNGLRRREVLGYAALATGMGLGIGPGTAVSREGRAAIESGDWPMFSYDGSGSFHNPSIDPPSENLEESWSIGLGRYPRLSIGDGTVFAVTDRVIALSTDGEQLWTNSLNGEQLREATIADHGLYVTSDESIWSMDPSNGDRRWQLSIDEVTDAEEFILLYPSGDDLLIAEPSVYVGDPERELRLSLVDARTGDLRWERAVIGPRHPAIDDDSVYVPSAEGLEALDRSSGERRWVAEVDFELSTIPAVTGDRLYCPGRDGLYALDPASGDVRWQTDQWESVTAPVDGESVYDVGSERLVAVDVEDGSIRWEEPTDGQYVRGVAGGAVYVDRQDALFVHDADDGALVDEFGHGEGFAWAAFDDDHVYVGTEGGTLYALTGDDDASQGGDDATVVEVVDYAFVPGSNDPLEIDPGTTVRFVWKDGGHNVVPTAVPEGSTWEGQPSIEDAGFEYEHTFEVEGRYEFVCEPHAGSGMEGEIVVGDPPFDGEDGDEDSRDGQEEDGNESDETGGDESDRSDGNDGDDDDPFGGDSGESGEDDMPGLGVLSAIAGLGAVAARLAGTSTDE